MNCQIHAINQTVLNRYRQYCYVFIGQIKAFLAKRNFSLKEQNGSGWYLAYVCVGPVLKWDSNLGPPGWKPSTNPLNHQPYTMYLTMRWPDLSE